MRKSQQHRRRTRPGVEAGATDSSAPACLCRGLRVVPVHYHVGFDPIPAIDSPEQRVRSERLRQVRDRTQSQGKRSCEMSEQPSQPSVFLSYAARDKAAAETVSNAMRQGGLDIRTADGSWAGRDLAETIATAGVRRVRARRDAGASQLYMGPVRIRSRAGFGHADLRGPHGAGAFARLLA